MLIIATNNSLIAVSDTCSLILWCKGKGTHAELCASLSPGDMSTTHCTGVPGTSSPLVTTASPTQSFAQDSSSQCLQTSQIIQTNYSILENNNPKINFKKNFEMFIKPSVAVPRILSFSSQRRPTISNIRENYFMRNNRSRNNNNNNINSNCSNNETNDEGPGCSICGICRICTCITLGEERIKSFKYQLTKNF